MAPRVTPITASSGVYPAAKALMPFHGQGCKLVAGAMPEASAISSTTLNNVRASSEELEGFRRFPPRSSAAHAPPECNSMNLIAQPREMTTRQNSAAKVNSLPSHCHMKFQDNEVDGSVCTNVHHSYHAMPPIRAQYKPTMEAKTARAKRLCSHLVLRRAWS